MCAVLSSVDVIATALYSSHTIPRHSGVPPDQDWQSEIRTVLAESTGSHFGFL